MTGRTLWSSPYQHDSTARQKHEKRAPASSCRGSGGAGGAEPPARALLLFRVALHLSAWFDSWQQNAGARPWRLPATGQSWRDGAAKAAARHFFDAPFDLWRLPATGRSWRDGAHEGSMRHLNNAISISARTCILSTLCVPRQHLPPPQSQ